MTMTVVVVCFWFRQEQLKDVVTRETVATAATVHDAFIHFLAVLCLCKERVDSTAKGEVTSIVCLWLEYVQFCFPLPIMLPSLVGRIIVIMRFRFVAIFGEKRSLRINR
jgi:hypothetical protein